MILSDDWVGEHPRLPLQIFAAGVVVLVLTSWLWWVKVSIDPGRVFTGMLQNSLRTSSTTLTLEQKGQTDTIKQVIQLQLGAENFARSVTTITQGTDVVTTEALGTTDADYTRYTTIKTSKAGPDGKPVNTKNLVNVWSKSTTAESAAQQTTQLFRQAVLGLGLPLGSLPVPVGNLKPAQREALLRQIKEDNVYAIDLTKVQKRTINGRSAYAYEINLQPILYVRLMQNFAKDLGLNDLENLDPNAFAGTQPLKLTLVVDARSRQLAAVNYPNKNYTETYSGYGVVTHLTLPNQTIPAAELQQRLSVLQN